MISQKCPRCSSRRIRAGYRSTPFIFKLICRYYLLCDNCNWTFSGFAMPFTVGKHTKHLNIKTSEAPLENKKNKQNPRKTENVRKKSAAV